MLARERPFVRHQDTCTQSHNPALVGFVDPDSLQATSATYHTAIASIPGELPRKERTNVSGVEEG